MRLFLDGDFFGPQLAAQRESVIDFARLLPAAGLLLRDVRAGRADPQRTRQVRADDVGPDRQQRHLGGRPGRLPVRVRDAGRAPSCQGGYSLGQELVLGLGSTLGIAAQFLILVPYLKAAGVHL